MARAQTLLADAVDSPEGGWVSLNLGMFEGDRVRKEQRFRDALEVARRFGDADLEFVTLAYLGASLVHSDRTEEGMTLLDEALAAVAGSEVDDFCVLEEIFCQLFSACEHACDVVRADSWIRIGDAIAERRKLPAVSAFCRTHYGGILTTGGTVARGRRRAHRRRAAVGTGSADAARRCARAAGRPARAAGPFRGGRAAARRPRCERRRRRGASARGDPAREGRDLARPGHSRAGPGTGRPTRDGGGPLLALLVDVHLAANLPDEAEKTVENLAACATRHASHHLLAAAALARGRVCLAAGTGDPQACLREALAGFARAQMPMEVARSRLELANALLTTRPEVAMMEARAALDAFERLQAARHADAAAGVLRSLGVRDLVREAGWWLADQARGRGARSSRPRAVQPRDVRAPVHQPQDGRAPRRQHPFKLGLRSRAEAAAYAARSKPGDI